MELPVGLLKAHLQQQLSYSAGVLVLDAMNAGSVLYRSPRPILSPEVPAEHASVVPNVVFPSGIDQRAEPDDLEGFDLYYGMADTRIGVARLSIPATLPQ